QRDAPRDAPMTCLLPVFSRLAPDSEENLRKIRRVEDASYATWRIHTAYVSTTILYMMILWESLSTSIVGYWFRLPLPYLASSCLATEQLRTAMEVCQMAHVLRAMAP